MSHAAFRYVLIFAYVALVSIAFDFAQARDIPIAGGPGGGAFRSDCRTQYLRGFNFRAGAFVDAIGPKCATFIDHQQQFGPTTALMSKGGRGGGSKSLECARSEFISAIRFGFTRDGDNPKYIDFVEITCKSIATGKTAARCLDTGGNCPAAHPDRPRLRSVTHTCNNNEWATGVHGRSGSYVDALGLICGPRPASLKPPGTGTAASGGGTTAPPPLTADQQAMLNAHNAKRALHCVPPMTWSAQLAANAQAWANQCRKDARGAPCHQNDCGTKSPDGENLSFGARWQIDAAGNKKATLPGRTANEAVDLWYCEIQAHDFNNPRLVGGTTSACTPVNGHFTQVVWRSSTQLGCAQSTCTYGNQGTLWVCKYSPAGNVNTPQALSQNVPRICKR